MRLSTSSSNKSPVLIPSPTTSTTKGSDLSNAKSNPDQFPEGGMAAWCTIIGAILVQFCGFGYESSFGVYQDFYTLHFLSNKSPSTISWIGGTSAFLLTACGIPAGLLYDRGYCYHLLIGGSLLQSFSLFMLSLAQPGKYYQTFLAQGIGLGVAQGMMYVPTMAVVSHYFWKRRTLAMSLVVSGVALGAIVHPIILNNLFNRIGFANSVRISAALVSTLLLIACSLIRTRLDSPKQPANYLSVAKGVVYDIPFCITAVALLCSAAGFYYPLFYLQLDSVKHGNSETFSFYSLVLLNGGSFMGRLSAGFIAPRVGVSVLTIISTAACGIVVLGMIGLSGVATVVVLGTIYGYFVGIYMAMIAPLFSLLTRDLSELGARIGIGMAVIGFGSFLGGPVSGALLTSQYKWLWPSLFSGFASLAGCSLLIAMQLVLTRCRNRTIKKETP